MVSNVQQDSFAQNHDLYAGDVDAKTCWDALASSPNAQMIDVRTMAEWTFVGVSDLSSLNKQTHAISWKMYPTMEVNSNFQASVKAVVPDTDAPLYFICKTGGRSLDAAIAMTAAGYRECYNVADGFEGPKDEQGHRGMVAGWKASQLPWEQV